MYEVIPNDNDKEREDSRGKVHVSKRRTWLVVQGTDCIDEYKRKRDAVDRARELNAQQSN